MTTPLDPQRGSLASFDDAPQHGPRPLPLFLKVLLQETADKTDIRQRALAGLRRFQATERTIRQLPPPKYVAQDRASLTHFATHDAPNQTPIVLIPSLINPSWILDLTEQTSLAHYLAARGHNIWLVDWGAPTAEQSQQDLGDHVEELLLPLLANLERPPVLVGYCLGGTLAIAAAQLTETRALATIAAPWDFAAYPEANRTSIDQLWSYNRPMAEELGMVPMEVLQASFWDLDPERLIRKYAAFAGSEIGSPDEAAFVAVEDWANEGEPLTLAAGRDVFTRLYRDNETALGKWTVGGKPMLLDALSCPTFSIRSLVDKIVPPEASPIFEADLPLALGHVGMIVSRKAPEAMWQPLSQWLSRQEG